jgi:hypothetical protein
MYSTNLQKDRKGRKADDPFSGMASGMELLGSIDAKNPQAQRSSNGVIREADTNHGHVTRI